MLVKAAHIIDALLVAVAESTHALLLCPLEDAPDGIEACDQITELEHIKFDMIRG